MHIDLHVYGLDNRNKLLPYFQCFICYNGLPSIPTTEANKQYPQEKFSVVQKLNIFKWNLMAKEFHGWYLGIEHFPEGHPLNGL